MRKIVEKAGVHLKNQEKAEIIVRKITVYILIICLSFLSFGCEKPREETELYNIALKSRKQESWDETTHSPRPETESILQEAAVLDLGDHMIAYYMPREEIDTAYTRHWAETFQGERYIAIRDLDHETVWYLPDIYGRLLEMEAEENAGLSLQYIPEGSEVIQEVHIPICFLSGRRGYAGL